MVINATLLQMISILWARLGRNPPNTLAQISFRGLPAHLVERLIWMGLPPFPLASRIHPLFGSTDVFGDRSTVPRWFWEYVHCESIKIEAGGLRIQEINQDIQTSRVASSSYRT